MNKWRDKTSHKTQLYFLFFKKKASEDLEDRESLAQMAASQNDSDAADGETYIEKYIRGVSAVESILTLDRLRQVTKKIHSFIADS